MKEFTSLVEIVERLRSKKGCPWDRKQRLVNLKSYLIEEVYEFLDALSSRNIPSIKEELGDLFLMLVFFARIFKEKSKFSLKDVLDSINRKLIKRHPHVFSNKEFKDAGAVLRHWYNLKINERRSEPAFSHIPRALPSLMKAYKIVKESKRRGILKLDKKTARRELSRKMQDFLFKPSKRGLQEALFLFTVYASFYRYEPEVAFLDFLRQRFKI